MRQNTSWHFLLQKGLSILGSIHTNESQSSHDQIGRKAMAALVKKWLFQVIRSLLNFTAPVQGQDVSIHWCIFMVVQAHMNTNHETFQCGGRQVALASLNTGSREWYLDSNCGQLQDLCQSPVWMLPSTSCWCPEIQVRGSEIIYLNTATLCNLFSLLECRVRKPGTGYTCQ